MTLIIKSECIDVKDGECTAVCPVDCCVADPNNVEEEPVLFERAKALHPDRAGELALSPETSRFRA